VGNSGKLFKAVPNTEGLKMVPCERIEGGGGPNEVYFHGNVAHIRDFLRRQKKLDFEGESSRSPKVLFFGDNPVADLHGAITGAQWETAFIHEEMTELNHDANVSSNAFSASREFWGSSLYDLCMKQRAITKTFSFSLTYRIKGFISQLVLHP
jgi:hypothetical protein